MRTTFVLIAVIAVLALAVPAQAGPITLNTPSTGPVMRTATLSDAVSGYGYQTMGPGQPDTSDLESYFGAGTLTRVGDKFASGGPNGAYNFNAILTSGDWGTSGAAGNWSFDSSLWGDYGEAIITIHVGGGPAEPDDHFAWMLESGDTTGTFSYALLSGTGGGFSNVQLWVRGTGTAVPEPASGLLLLGALVGFVGLRRRRARS